MERPLEGQASTSLAGGGVACGSYRDASRHRPTPASPSVAPEWPHLDRSELRDWMAGGDLDCFLEAVALDEVEPADRLLRLRERAIGDELLPVAYTHRAAAPWRRQLVTGDPSAACLQVVEPRK